MSTSLYHLCHASWKLIKGGLETTKLLGFKMKGDRAAPNGWWHHAWSQEKWLNPSLMLFYLITHRY